MDEGPGFCLKGDWRREAVIRWGSGAESRQGRRGAWLEQVRLEWIQVARLVERRGSQAQGEQQLLKGAM